MKAVDNSLNGACGSASALAEQEPSRAGAALSRGSETGGDFYRGKTFGGHPARHRRMTEVVRAYAAADHPLRILEIGCGTGIQLCQLARELPLATCTGVDMSDANIRLARAHRDEHLPDDRLSFLAADYMQLCRGPFDLIVSDSTLHLVGTASPLELFSKIANDLAPGGLLIASIPYDCLSNRVLWLLRRGLRCVRGRATDAAILAVAKLIYGRRYNPEFLAESVSHMYLLGSCCDGNSLRRLLTESCGLEFVREHPAPHTSFARPKHHIIVFRKRNPTCVSRMANAKAGVTNDNP